MSLSVVLNWARIDLLAVSFFSLISIEKCVESDSSVLFLSTQAHWRYMPRATFLGTVNYVPGPNSACSFCFHNPLEAAVYIFDILKYVTGAHFLIHACP